MTAWNMMITRKRMRNTGIKWVYLEYADGYCGGCLKQVMCARKRVSHLNYLIGTTLTFGIFGFYWFRAAKRARGTWRCRVCNTEIYKLLSHIY